MKHVITLSMILLALATAGCGARTSAQTRLLDAGPAGASEATHASAVEPGPPTRLEPAGPLPWSPLALAAVTDDARTFVSALSADGQRAELLSPRLVGDVQFAGPTVAYLGLTGVDPAANFIETVALDGGPGWRIEPAEGHVLFGFALDAAGRRLAYLEVSQRASSRAVPWRLVALDLGAGQRRVVRASPGLSADGQRDPALLPVAWSPATGGIYAQALVPYYLPTGLGLWAAPADGSAPRQLLAEADYVGWPRLSPDGRRLAYLASDPNLLPPDYRAGAGAPPANVLRMLDLRNGETRAVARTDGGAYRDVVWSPDSRSTLLVYGRWDSGAFRSQAIVTVALDGSAPREVVSLPGGDTVGPVAPCAAGGVLYVTHGPHPAVMRLSPGSPSQVVLSLPSGTVESLVCLR